MSNLAASDVTYTMIKQATLADSRKFNIVKLVFGDGALTVPSGGIALTKGKLGCPTTIDSLVVFDQSTSGYKYQYDKTNEKLIVMQAPAETHSHDVKLIGGLTLDAAVGMNSTTFGKNTATNATIEGVNSATLGGVVSATLAAAALSQATGAAPAAQTLYVEVIGW